MFQTIKNILVFPVAFAYVMVFVFFSFLRLFFEGNHVEYIIQILFVEVQNRLDKLVYRAAWLTPIVDGIILLKIILSVHHI